MKNILVFSFVAFFALSCGSSPSPYKVKIGNEGHIITDGEMATISKEIYADVISSHWANDSYANDQRVLNGELIVIEKNVRVLVIDYDYVFREPLSKVRVLEGKHKNKAVYVTARSIQ